MITVHALWHGRALCGLPRYPGDWPLGHTWWAANQWDRIVEALDADPRSAETCLICPICDRVMRDAPRGEEG